MPPTIHGTGIFTLHLVDFDGKLVGKYTSPMGSYACWNVTSPASTNPTHRPCDVIHGCIHRLRAIHSNDLRANTGRCGEWNSLGSDSL